MKRLIAIPLILLLAAVAIAQVTVGTVNGIKCAVDAGDTTTPIETNAIQGGIQASVAKWVAERAHTAGHIVVGTGNQIWLGANNAVHLERVSNDLRLAFWTNIEFYDQQNTALRGEWGANGPVLYIGDILMNYADGHILLGTNLAPSGGNSLVFGDSPSHPAGGSDTSQIYAVDRGDGIVQPYATNESGSDHQPLVPYKEAITLAAAATTFAADGTLCEITGDAGTNTIATITGERAFAGARLVLLFVDGNVTITDDNSHAADSVDLSAAFTSADDTTLDLMHDGTSWYEIGRSVN